jgi:Undecaprenyl-phosphate glucose phosphotransferase
MLQSRHTKNRIYSSAVPAPLSVVGAANGATFEANPRPTTQLTTALASYIAFEFVVVFCSNLFALYFYHNFIVHSWSWHRLTNYAPAAVLIATLVLFISLAFRNFSAIRRKERGKFLWSGIGAISLAFSIFISLMFFTQLSELYSRGTLVFQFIGSCIALGASRELFVSWLRTAIRSDRIEARRIALIGEGNLCLMFADRLKSSGIQTVGSFSSPKQNTASDKGIVSPEFQRLSDKLRSLRLDDIVILANKTISPELLKFTTFLAELPASVHVLPTDSLDIIASAKIAQFGNLRTLQLFRPPLSAFDIAIKRTFDFTFAAISLIVLSPLFLLVSLAIKLDSSGPIFFRQMRHGFNNEEINVFKFRSMTSENNGMDFEQAVENDKRVTRVGKIIRRTNIDELPQLINVLRGEMSIVGPRPHATTHNELFNNLIAPFSRRHNVKPGITGWAQVNGFRGVTDTVDKMQHRVEYDLYYVDNWSFLFDIKIILITLFSKRAYINAY